MSEEITFKIDSITIGDKTKGDRIVFKSVADMKQGYEAIDNGRDLYLLDNDGLVTLILNKIITSKIADGSIQMCALSKKEE
jgi:hypothetical protein